MKSPQILYSSAEIHARIKRLFGQPSKHDQRVALVAYVGSDGASYLPHPEGLRVICNPSAGGTDPDTLRHLIKHGAKVELSDKLHMKVYWSRTRGCIVTSANASSSALGVASLKEAGVFLPPRVVKIDRLIKYAKPRPVRPEDLHRLDKQARAHPRSSGHSEKRTLDFAEWYLSPHRSKWKMARCLEAVAGSANAAKEQTKAEYGHKEPYTWVNVRKGQIRRNEWLLTTMPADQDTKPWQWIYVDFVVKIDPREKCYYDRGSPYHAVQVNSPSKCPLPPFAITSEFRKAFRSAVRKYSPVRFMKAKSDAPAARFLKLLAQEMKAR